jgi:hypothetical protein
MGKSEDLPTLDLQPAAPRLAALLEQRPRKLYVLEPTSRRVFSSNDLETAAAQGTRIYGVCNEFNTTLRGVPAGTPLIRIATSRWRMIPSLLKLAFLTRRADALVLDIDSVCGLLGLGARRILLLVDDNCVEARGGPRALLRSLIWPFRWIRVLLLLVRFAFARERLRQAGALTPTRHMERIRELGGIRLSGAGAAEGA